MTSDAPQYEIHQIAYNIEWDEEDTVLHSGMNKTLMERLYFATKNVKGDRIIRIYLTNKEGIEYEPNEGYY